MRASTDMLEPIILGCFEGTGVLDHDEVVAHVLPSAPCKAVGPAEYGVEGDGMCQDGREECGPITGIGVLVGHLLDGEVACHGLPSAPWEAAGPMENGVESDGIGQDGVEECGPITGVDLLVGRVVHGEVVNPDDHP